MSDYVFGECSFDLEGRGWKLQIDIVGTWGWVAVLELDFVKKNYLLN